jgi:hypothetical protein
VNAEPVTLDEYAAGLASAAREAGLERARRGDPDGFDLAVGIIRRLAWSGETFTADTVRSEILIASNAVGTAFAHLRCKGVIESVGYTTSTATSRHGGTLRLWRGRAP